MNPHQLQERNKSLVKQRNLLAAGAMAGLVATSLVSLVALAQETSVVIIPSTVNETTIVRGRVPDQYLMDLTRDVSNLLFNRHPNDGEYFRTNILRLVEPRYHDVLSAKMAQDEIENRYKAGERVWRPERICVPHQSGDTIASEVLGVLDTYVNDRKVESLPIAQRFVWSVSGTRVFLQDSSRVEREETDCLTMTGGY